MRGIATHTQVHSQILFLFSFVYFSYVIYFDLTKSSKCAACSQHCLHRLQALHAQTSVAAGMKGASKAMAAMNKVVTFYL